VNGTLQANTTSDKSGADGAGDVNTADGCSRRALLLQACGWLQNSQLVNYCKAFEAIEGDGKGNVGPIISDAIMAAIDAVVAGVCWAPCIDPLLLPSMGNLCSGLSLGAGAIEIVDTVVMGAGSVASYIQTAGGGLAMAAGAGGLIAVNAAKSAATEGMKDGSKEATQAAGKAGNTTGARVMACASAVLFTMMAVTPS